MNADTTRPSLLSRVRDPANQQAWSEFDARYRDLILGYCRARGIQHFDAEDVRQAVMLNLSAALRGFEYRPDRGRFRDYLGRVVRGAISRVVARPNRPVGGLSMSEVADETESCDPADDPLWESEWVSHHYRLAMETIRTQFDPRSVEAFEALVAGRSVEQAALDFDMSEQAVHKVKQRIRDRMRELVARQIAEENADA
jgi:RNA polymerase sigma-70 factor (ECF subfamily)